MPTQHIATLLGDVAICCDRLARALLLILPKTKLQLTLFCYLRDSTFGFAEAKGIFQLLEILSLF